MRGRPTLAGRGLLSGDRPPTAESSLSHGVYVRRRGRVYTVLPLFWRRGSEAYVWSIWTDDARELGRGTERIRDIEEAIREGKRQLRRLVP